jgi:hypothetical protein
MTGGRFEENLVYGNASGPLLFNAVKTKSEWRDNLFQQEGTPPNEYIEVVKALTGLEPAYQKRLLGIEPNPCLVSPPVESMPDGSFDVRQYYLPARERGVVRIMRERGESAVRIPLRMQGLTPGRRYGLKVYHGMLAPAAKDFYAEYTKVEKLWLPYANALGDLPILSDVGNIEPATIGLKTDSADHTVAAEQLAGGTEEIELPAGAQVVWIAYRAE